MWEMFKKFNYQLNHNPVGSIWGITLAMLLCCLFVLSVEGGGLVSKKDMILLFLSYTSISNFIYATYILVRIDNKPKKLCKHDWEFIDKNEGTTVIGCAVDIDMVYTYQCKSCLEVRKSYHLWEGIT